MFDKGDPRVNARSKWGREEKEHRDAFAVHKRGQGVGHASVSLALPGDRRPAQKTSRGYLFSEGKREC